MKNLKNILTMLLVSALLLTIGCKKKTIYPEGQDPNQNLANSVSANDLENYYLVGETNTGKKLMLIYFSKEGATVKANMHIIGALRIADAVVSKSKFTFDFDTNGNRLYNFEFEKDAAGLIKLKNYSINDKTIPTLKLDHAMLVKKTDSSVFSNSSFKVGDLLFKVNDTNILEWDIKLRQIDVVVINGQPFPILGLAPDLKAPIYSLANLGFKSNDDTFIGIAVPNWKAYNTPVLLIERPGTVVMPGVKQ